MGTFISCGLWAPPLSLSYSLLRSLCFQRLLLCSMNAFACSGVTVGAFSDYCVWHLGHCLENSKCAANICSMSKWKWGKMPPFIGVLRRLRALWMGYIYKQTQIWLLDTQKIQWLKVPLFWQLKIFIWETNKPKKMRVRTILLCSAVIQDLKGRKEKRVLTPLGSTVSLKWDLDINICLRCNPLVLSPGFNSKPTAYPSPWRPCENQRCPVVSCGWLSRMLPLDWRQTWCRQGGQVKDGSKQDGHQTAPPVSWAALPRRGALSVWALSTFTFTLYIGFASEKATYNQHLKDSTQICIWLSRHVK